MNLRKKQGEETIFGSRYCIVMFMQKYEINFNSINYQERKKNQQKTRQIYVGKKGSWEVVDGVLCKVVGIFSSFSSSELMKYK